ncbi:hypothetical protein FRC10_010420, partial [Ceratobasidium sp. 414]
MVYPRTHQIDPACRSRLLSRILDPEYSGAPPTSYSGSLRPRSPALADLPQPSVFVDMWGQEHDPDFRPFATYPVVTPAVEHETWPWDADDSPGSTSPRRSPTIVSHSSSSYHSSSSGSRSASVLPTPASSPPTLDADKDRPRISPPGTIPRAALFPWTPAQRAARLHEVTKRNFPPPPPLHEEEPETPLTLVDSRYVPGYGHVLPSQARRARTMATSAESSTTAHKKGRFRSHTVPVPARARAELAEDAEDESESEEEQPRSPSSTHSFRQSIYSFGLRTKLGLYHMKTRVRKASSAALRPLS